MRPSSSTSFSSKASLRRAKAVLAEYRERKDARGAAWSADELYTLAPVARSGAGFSRSRALLLCAGRERQQTPDAEQKGLAGLTRILLDRAGAAAARGRGQSCALSKALPPWTAAPAT